MSLKKIAKNFLQIEIVGKREGEGVECKRKQSIFLKFTKKKNDIFGKLWPS